MKILYIRQIESLNAYEMCLSRFVDDTINHKQYKEEQLAVVPGGVIILKFRAGDVIPDNLASIPNGEYWASDIPKRADFNQPLEMLINSPRMETNITKIEHMNYELDED